MTQEKILNSFLSLDNNQRDWLKLPENRNFTSDNERSQRLKFQDDEPIELMIIPHYPIFVPSSSLIVFSVASSQIKPAQITFFMGMWTIHKSGHYFVTTHNSTRLKLTYIPIVAVY